MAFLRKYQCIGGKQSSHSNGRITRRASYYVSRRKLQMHSFAQYLMDNYSSGDSSDDSDSDEEETPAPKIFTSMKTISPNTTLSTTMSTDRRGLQSKIARRKDAMEFSENDLELNLNGYIRKVPVPRKECCTNDNKKDSCADDEQRVTNSEFVNTFQRNDKRPLVTNSEFVNTFQRNDKRPLIGAAYHLPDTLPIKVNVFSKKKDLTVKEIMARMSNYDISSAKIEEANVDDKTFY